MKRDNPLLSAAGYNEAALVHLLQNCTRPVLSSPCSNAHFPRQQSFYAWLGGTCCVANTCSLASGARQRAQPTLFITFTVSVLLILIRNTARRSHQPLRFAKHASVGRTRIRRYGGDRLNQSEWHHCGGTRVTKPNSTESLFPDTASAVRADKETVTSLAIGLPPCPICLSSQEQK